MLHSFSLFPGPASTQRFPMTYVPDEILYTGMKYSITTLLSLHACHLGRCMSSDSEVVGTSIASVNVCTSQEIANHKRACSLGKCSGCRSSIMTLLSVTSASGHSHFGQSDPLYHLRCTGACWPGTGPKRRDMSTHSVGSAFSSGRPAGAATASRNCFASASFPDTGPASAFLGCFIRICAFSSSFAVWQGKIRDRAGSAKYALSLAEV